MVYLHRIYTRTGDDGQTSLGDGSRVLKTSARIRAYGGVDELNASLGVAAASGLPDALADRVRRVQNDLFDLGADLCVPDGADVKSALRVTADQATALERWIDEVTERLEPLTSFVLPGGSVGSAHLHVARTICRRVEIEVLALAATESINPQCAVYLNRLSDWLFVAARHCNDGGKSDVLWVPGQSQQG